MVSDFVAVIVPDCLRDSPTTAGFYHNWSIVIVPRDAADLFYDSRTSVTGMEVCAS